MRSPRSLLALCLATLSLAGACAGAPPVIRDEIARSPRGVVTIVFFTDFQCPFCRRTHEALAPLLERHEGRVRLVLRHVPLRSHPDARTAARAAVCGERLGAGDAVAHDLFRAPDLGERAVVDLAISRGLARAAFEACLADAATEARIARDTEAFDSVEGDGVPLLWIGGRRLDGAQSRGALEEAIEEALAEAR